ncbi:hypothetical protein APHAL10511_008055 [Amanita phalloides]|nr:hypothetical protein APHAL10511_008055 [Amanita phalloides]
MFLTAQVTLGQHIPLDETMGVMFIGTLISAVLLGVTLVQAYDYFDSRPKNGLYLTVLVAVLVILDMIHLSMITQIVYYHLITTYYNAAKTTSLTWSARVQALCTGLSSNIVQFHYAVWIWRLSKNRLLLWFTLATILAQFGCGMGWVIISTRISTYTQLVRLTALTVASNSLTAFIDVMNAVSLIIILCRSRSGLYQSDSLINKMIFFVVGTGSLTSLCAMGVVFLLVAMPGKLVSSLFYDSLGRLHIISFIIALNARRSLIQQPNGSSHPQFTSVSHGLVTGPTSDAIN